MPPAAPSSTPLPVGNDAVAALQAQLARDAKLKDLLAATLVASNQQAQQGLNGDLYEALGPWPTNTDEYLDYLRRFATYVPTESTEAVWLRPDSEENYQPYSAEIFDRLCQFYWLIDPDDAQGTGGLQNYVDGDFSFADWIVAYNNEWGNFLNTPDSLTPETLQSFKDDKAYDVARSSKYIESWHSFNDFFSRELNPGVLSVTDPDDNKTIVAPAECTFQAVYPIDEKGNIPRIKLKHTHSVNAVEQLLQSDSDLAQHFYGGTYMHSFLSPYDYHRFHTPVAGEVVKSLAVQAKNFLQVTLDTEAPGQFNAPDDVRNGYEFNQARGVLVIDTSKAGKGQDVGMVAVVPVGMAQVSSVEMTMPEGQKVAKGDEFGYFAFGGSDIILLFEKPPTDLKIREGTKDDPQHFEPGDAAVYWKG